MTETSTITLPDGIEIFGEIKPGYEEILTEEALGFIAGLERKFGPKRLELLERRLRFSSPLRAEFREGPESWPDDRS